MRLYKSPLLTEPYHQQGSPETNLYSFYNASERYKNMYYFPISLPFWGEWTVTQGHNGEHTHKEEWKHAWDFEIHDHDRKPFKDLGLENEDYYCYNALVLAPAAGYVIQIIDGVPDNKIGDVNTADNWGNTIIIKHSEFLYSKLCHLREGSFKIYIGEYVRLGQPIALCGSSGRSPQPHLHFQLQTTPYIGSKTLDYPIAHYIKKENESFSLNSFNKPEKDSHISNIAANPLLAKTFHFIPGQKLEFDVIKENEKELVQWEVFTDIYNTSYLYCEKSNSFAYFVNDGNIFYFRSFTGDKTSLLYYFFLAFYKVQLGYYPKMVLNDIYPVNLLFNKKKLFLQDFIAPFYMFMKAEYEITYVSVDNDLSPSLINLQSSAKTFLINQNIATIDFQITINENGISKINITDKNKKQLFEVSKKQEQSILEKINHIET
jgi:murein DD-endopeptidase MepM/ murein hydrolase activator NlpD